MSLTLVTGPANAAKAGVAFERLRLQAERQPLLVVPTDADVDHYQRELAASGQVFGIEVMTFARLIGSFAERVELPGSRLGRVAAERVLRAAIADVELDALAGSAASPGFVAAAGVFVAEMQRNLVTPARLTSALREWESEGATRRSAQVREILAVYSAYRRRLARLDAHDGEGHAWAALDALRRRPAAWDRRPVSFYGFDDLTRIELDAVETLVRLAEADVLVALPYEPGRSAFAGRATTVELLRPLAGEHVQLPERSEHYATSSRAALHHLERFLFEPAPPVAASCAGLQLLEAGGERAEAELVGAEVSALVESGVPCDEVAVLVGPQSTRHDLMVELLEGYGVPVARDRPMPLTRTRLGAGIAALARAAGPEGTAEDLLRWLRTPGRLESPEPADRLELEVRRRQVTGARGAARLWAGPPEIPAALEAIAAAAATGPLALLEALGQEARGIWMAPHARTAPVFDARSAVDAGVVTELDAAVRDLRRLTRADPGLLPDAAGVLEALASMSVRERGTSGGVLLAGPLDIRARRFRAVFSTGLQDGELPRRPTPDPFLDDDDRRALARASGLALPLGEDALAGERYLFYAVCSRPTERLALSWRSSSEEGDPLQASPFLQDVRGLFGPELWSGRRRRLLAEVTWPLEDAPTRRELERALAAREHVAEPAALGAPVTQRVLAALAAREHESARGLETFAGCGVAWLIEAVLRPQPIEPDPEPLWRGTLAHGVLEQVLSRLKERSGSARLTAESLPGALAVLDEVMAERGREPRYAGVPERVVLRAVRADVTRYLREECATGPGLEPLLLEWSFGRSGEDPAAFTLAGGMRVSGRVDRVDGDGTRAVVRDYKHRVAPPGARWGEDRKLQAGLYALAVREILGLEPAAALYQPLSAGDLRPRGIIRNDLPGRYVPNDVLDDEDFEAALDEVRGIADEAARSLRAGRVSACPARCSARRACRYPTICRPGDASEDAPSDPVST